MEIMRLEIQIESPYWDRYEARKRRNDDYGTVGRAGRGRDGSELLLGSAATSAAASSAVDVSCTDTPSTGMGNGDGERSEAPSDGLAAIKSSGTAG